MKTAFFTVVLTCLFFVSYTYSVIRKNRHHSLNTAKDSCGYASCPAGDPNLINVHIVPHTHDDVGWLKTVDQYFYGAKNDIQVAGVQYILDSVIQALNNNPDRKFIYVETAFFWRWLQEQDEAIINNVRDLVNQGRLTIINGAWSMNDEATTHYSSIIENFAWGLRRLSDTFGACGRPTVGWQIDPFGHSREFASLLSQIGFDGLFLGRIDYQDKSDREDNRTMEMLWTGSQTLGDASNLFTGVLPNGYSPPSGFCFDVLCRDAPVMDDRRLADYNVDQLVANFIHAMKTEAAVYATNHIIVTMGEDFNYQDADMWFKNLDKLINYVNDQKTNGSKVNLFYSNPACYLYALNQADKTWPSKEDDFFPYGSGPHSYWTGYFTSRPAIKRFERDASRFLPVCKQVSYFSGMASQQLDEIAVLREALGVTQHHDAVAGTEKQAVAFDYAQRLDIAIKSCQNVVSNGLSKLANVSLSAIGYCDLLNISQCSATENHKNVAVILWNTLGRSLQQYINLPVPDGDFIVTDPGGKQIPFQLTPLFHNVKQIPERVSTATQELTFYAELPAMGFGTYGIQRSTGASFSQHAKVYTDRLADDDVVMQNDYISASFDIVTGLLQSFTNKETMDTTLINQTFLFYEGCAADNSVEEKRSSGAYIFRPNCTGFVDGCKVAFGGVPTYEVVQGPLVQEIRQRFNSWVSQIIRLHAKSRYLEFEWQVGPIPIEDGVGKEIVSVFTSDFNSNATFFTDSNGRQNIIRKRNYRPSFKLNVTEPISGNYYPVNNRIFLRDPVKRTQLTILTDRAQGGSSIVDGQLELMVHRRLLHDDDFGVGEALNETANGKGLVVRGKHYLLFSKTSTATADYRPLNEEIYWYPYPIFVALSSADQLASVQKHKPSKGAFASSTDLPVNIHLLSLEQWSESSILLRLEHVFEANEDPVFSTPVTVDLRDIIGDNIDTVEEMTLDGNVPLTSIQRLKWKSQCSSSNSGVRRTIAGSFNVTINPMEIRTFQIALK